MKNWRRRSIIPQQPVNVWNPLHAHFIRFAYDSLMQSKPRQTSVDWVRLDRATVDTILYSNVALEAAVESALLFAQIGHLSRPLTEWGKEHCSEHRWTSRHLFKRFEFFARALGDEPFWTNASQRQLFQDLRRLRNELTHSRPVGMELRRSNVLQALAVRLIEPDRQVNAGRCVANFVQTPDWLGREDAEQAFEILIRHLIRLEEIGGIGLSFAIFDERTMEHLAPVNLLSKFTCRFEEAWEGRETT